MLYNAFMAGSGVDPFHHARVRVAHEVGHLRGGFSVLLHLRAEGGAEVRVAVPFQVQVRQGPLAHLRFMGVAPGLISPQEVAAGLLLRP